MRRTLPLLAAFVTLLCVPAAHAAKSAAPDPALSGASGGGTWTLLLERRDGGLCVEVRTVTPDGFAGQGSSGCVRPALRFFGDVVANGNGIKTTAGTPVVAATAGVVTARARRVVCTFTGGRKLRMTTQAPPAALRKAGGERIRVFGADALALPPDATLRKVVGYDARGRVVARNKAPMFAPDPVVRAPER
jgi:hypothetical protein